MQPASLFGLTPEALVALAAERGVPVALTDARRVIARAVGLRPGEPEPRSPVARVARAFVAEHCVARPLTVLERATDDFDGFVKYLFQSPDGAFHEAVRIPLAKPGHFTVCLSSQVGCAMGCDFCATGRLGLTRNLEPWEMVAAWKQVRDEAPGRVTGAVFMGQGEPLQNLDGVLGAARILSHPCGGRISADAITVSTVGLVPQIRRFARQPLRCRLIVSLTSAIPERRRALLPVAGRLELADLADALGEVAERHGGPVTVAWVMLGGVNLGADEVAALSALLGHLRVRVNLIDVNDARVGGYLRPEPAEVDAFAAALRRAGFGVQRRYSGGARKHAACGMLAALCTEGQPDAPVPPPLMPSVPIERYRGPRPSVASE